MDHISNYLPHSNNSTTPYQKHSDISIHSNKAFETEFAKLWLKLESLYVKQKFSSEFGGVNSSTARSWRVEFKRNKITENELAKIRNNLIKLKNPEFVPNPLTLINLLKDTECRTMLGDSIDPRSLPDENQIKQTRIETLSIKNECMDLLREILKMDVGQDVKKPKSWLEKIAPGPTDTMVKLVHNHNRLLISQGLPPLDYKRCKKRAFELGLK